MTTKWLGVHLPAAQAWIRTEADLRRYMEDRAADINLMIDNVRTDLAALDPEDRAAHIERWVQRWKTTGNVPYTTQDALDAAEKAKALARKEGPGWSPKIGVSK